MTTLTRKQREVRDREAQILEVARNMLLEQGYHGLSMDRIAEALEYSKGTMYQHFSCKEEIILALVNASLTDRLVIFRKAASYPSRPRERIAAVGVGVELFVRLYPHHFKLEQVLRLSSVWEKTSPERRQFMHHCESQCVGCVSGIVRDAIAQGDLTLPEGVTPEQLVFGLWSMSFGAQTILASSTSLVDIGIGDPHRALAQNQARLLDGYGWRPLSSEFDYEALSERIAREYFAKETEQAMKLAQKANRNSA
ncbi:MAG: TetR family transcriptional regulator [Planctomycetota bacterium]|nr:MAG: TetR family transcriptional regulator [Planctomycetota bacterium]